MIDGIPGPEEENNQVVSSRKWVETICLAAKSKQIREAEKEIEKFVFCSFGSLVSGRRHELHHMLANYKFTIQFGFVLIARLDL